MRTVSFKLFCEISYIAELSDVPTILTFVILKGLFVVLYRLNEDNTSKFCFAFDSINVLLLKFPFNNVFIFIIIVCICLYYT